MRQVIAGVGEWTAGTLTLVALVTGMCLLFRRSYLVPLMFFGHLCGFAACRRAVFPWLISPYRFYASLMYKNAVSFVPPSAVCELSVTFVCLYAYYCGMYSTLARLYVHLNCQNQAVDPGRLASWVHKAAVGSFLLTVVAKSLGPLKSMMAVGPVGDMEYADDILTGALSAVGALAVLMYLIYWKKSFGAREWVC